MATNGNFITTGYNDRCLKFEWELESQNSYTGVSTISWRLIGVGSPSQSYYQTSNIKVIIDGTTAYSYAPQSALWEGTVAASGYYSFAQTSSGSKSFTVEVKASIHTSEENCSGSGSWVLPNINIIEEPPSETESTFELSATNINIGGTITADIISSNANYTHDVEFYLSGYGGGSTSAYYTKYTGVNTSQSFTVPETWYNYMVSTDTCVAYCKVTTKYNGVIVGSEVIKPFTVKVLSSVVPTIGEIVLDPDDFTIGGTSYDYLVKGKNKLTLSVSGCVPTPGSKIESYTFSGPSINTTITTTNDSATTSISSVSSYGELTYKVTIKDSRGHKYTIQKDISCYNYQRPSFAFFNASRDGRMLTCTYTPLFSDVNNKNTATVKIYANDILIYTDENVENNTKISREITLNYDKKYDVYAEITDALGESASSKDTETYGSDKILNLASDGLGLAIGKMSTQDGLECSWDAQFYGDVNISQSINVDGDGDVAGILTVGSDIKAYGGMSVFNDIMVDGGVYADSLNASVFYGNVDGTYVDVNKVMTNNVIMSGKLYQSTNQGNKLIYGITSSGTSPNLQVGSPGSTAYNNATMYAPGNIYLVPGGTYLDNDGWTVVIRNRTEIVDGVPELKRGVSVNGNISCDGNMYINSKRVLTTEDLDGTADTPEINNGHYHSGKTLKCIKITPMQEDGSTPVDTLTVNADIIATNVIVDKNIKPSGDGNYACGTENHRWSTVYTNNVEVGNSSSTITNMRLSVYGRAKIWGRVLPPTEAEATAAGSSVPGLGDEDQRWAHLYANGLHITGNTSATASITGGAVIIENLPKASNNGANVRIDANGRLYKVDDSLVYDGTGGNGDILSSDNTFTGTNTFSKAVTMSSTLSVTGRITTSSAIVPSSNSSYALGLSDYRWSTVYANNMNISGEVYNESGQRKYAYYSHTHDNLTATAVFG